MIIINEIIKLAMQQLHNNNNNNTWIGPCGINIAFFFLVYEMTYWFFFFLKVVKLILLLKQLITTPHSAKWLRNVQRQHNYKSQTNQ